MMMSFKGFKEGQRVSLCWDRPFFFARKIIRFKFINFAEEWELDFSRFMLTEFNFSSTVPRHNYNIIEKHLFALWSLRLVVQYLQFALADYLVQFPNSLGCLYPFFQFRPLASIVQLFSIDRLCLLCKFIGAH